MAALRQSLDYRTTLLEDQSLPMSPSESCRPPPPYTHAHVDLSPMLVAAEGDVASPLLPVSAPVDLSSLHPELLKEVQHVVIARVVHLSEIIRRVVIWGVAMGTHDPRCPALLRFQLFDITTFLLQGLKLLQPEFCPDAL